MTDLVVRVADRNVPVSSLDRVLYPATGTTKAKVVDYYVRVAPYLLPYLRGRPATLHRFPEGVGGPHFFQTRVPPHPPWVRTARMAFPRSGKTFDAAVVDDLPSLVWAANLSTLELHPYLGLADAQDRPLVMVFDLDPGEPAGMREACAVALRVRDALAADGLAAYPKASGAKGVHVYVPVRDATYDDTKGYAKRLAALLTRETPDLVVDRMTRALRPGKVLVDWSQNDIAQVDRRAVLAARAARADGLDAGHVGRGRGGGGGRHRRAVLRPGRRAGPADRVGDLFAPVLHSPRKLVHK